MAQSEFKSLDFYGKLDYMLGICGEARRGLERIVSADAAWRYITEVCDQLEREFATFREDEDFSNAGNFRVSYRSFSAAINDVRKLFHL